MTGVTAERRHQRRPILQPGSNCMGSYRATATGLLVDSCDYYRAFYRAALQARRYILLAGWQFDSEVQLLRGAEAAEAEMDVRLLPFLESLCRRAPELEIYILAWDFSVVFSLEREWFQDFIFNWSSNERIHFNFDGKHAVGATHHQKFVIVDGEIAFVGGMDICSDRWDDRRHLLENPNRKNVDGISYGAYHDIQSYHTGPVVKELVKLFQQRWLDSGKGALIFPAADGKDHPAEEGMLRLRTGTVAISRTRARDFQSPFSLHEIRRLFIDAIMAAEELIYLENQYFSSQAIYWTLVNRMTATDRPPLQVVMILPDRLPFTEELFLGMPQMKMIRALRQIAAETGTSLGIYATVCGKQGERKMTFIHSKLLLVDDRFLTVGSANATNRSMGLDTELNVSWDAAIDGGEELMKSIRQIRASLLAEHAAMEGTEALRRLESTEGLVAYLDRLAADPATRLCPYAPEQSLESSNWHGVLEPVSRIVDPERPHLEEFVFEKLSRFETSIFARGIVLLSQWLSGILL